MALVHMGKASNKPHRHEVQEAHSGSGGFDGRQPVLPLRQRFKTEGC
jgi:hypothetical protein